MSENKLKKFLVNGFQNPEEGEEEVDGTDAAEVLGDDIPEEMPEESSMDEAAVPECMEDALQTINDELLKMRYILEDIRSSEPKAEMPDMEKYLTDREQMKAVTQAIERRDADAANRNLVRTMEQISVMREDFFKLCKGMRERIDRMSAEDVLSSFEAYSVDMENILLDGGVHIGPFPYDRLNTLHQRIVDVIPTDDEEKNGMIAERLSDGYKIGSKVLLKEKVAIYKFTKADKPAEPAEEAEAETVPEQEPETPLETDSEDTPETTSETVSAESENKETDTQEDKE